jgi:hypothetical protein
MKTDIKQTMQRVLSQYDRVRIKKQWKFRKGIKAKRHKTSTTNPPPQTTAHHLTFGYVAKFFVDWFSLCDQIKTETQSVWPIRLSLYLQ